MGKITRNIIYLLGNKSLQEQWQALNLPNTQVINLTRDELRRNVIGHCKKAFAPANDK